MSKRVLIILCLVFGAVLSTVEQGAAQNEGARVLVLTADGPVTPAMHAYLSRGIRTAELRGCDLLVFELNTPGGSISVMNDIVETLRASPLPVVVYVSPRGAMAASAGTIITLAGHAAAMAPETIIGAASPVGAEGEDLGETMEAKEKNALMAMLDTLMERRSSEAIKLAKETVQEAKAVSARQALEVGMIDFIAVDLEDLLRQLDGFTVYVAGAEKPLNLGAVDEISVTRLSHTLIEELLQLLTDPNIVFLLITIGVQAVLIELSSPGGWVAGFIGVVCLALATYGLGILPVNWFGIVFLIIAFVLFILDIKAPTHGALTAAGVGSLIVGALVLFNSPGTPVFQRVSVPLVIGVSIFTAIIFFIIVSFAVRAQRLPAHMGQESLLGKRGVARSTLNPHGAVQLAGELWSAELSEGEAPIPKGSRVVVERVEGVRLFVRKA